MNNPISFQPWLPAWVQACVGREEMRLHTDEERMDFVIRLAQRNLQEGTGGPFAAAVFERDSGLLVSVGVNVVIASHCSYAHAEMIALGLAQQRYQSHTLSANHLPVHELVTSCEPCAMCLGALQGSGIQRLVYAATDSDVRAIGFESGLKPVNWQRALERRGIDVMTDVYRLRSVAVLQAYLRQHGMSPHIHRL